MRQGGFALLLALCTALSGAQSQKVVPVEGSPFWVTGLSRAEAQAFLEALQAAVQSGDASRVARLTFFPLTVNGRPGPADAGAFTREFATLFNERVRRAVRRGQQGQRTR